MASMLMWLVRADAAARESKKQNNKEKIGCGI